MHPLKLLLAHAAVFGIALTISAACKVEYPTTAFRCSPAGGAPHCPDGYQCCSDDPAAIDLDDITAFVTPEYEMRGGQGVPLFSGGNNSLSRTGMCVREGSVPIQGALIDTGAQGCPIPCNPKWDSDTVEDICGNDTICCQTVELEPEDCVEDENGCYRPVTGNDIEELGGLDATTWSAAEHRTHQDPGGKGCGTFVAGVSASILEDKGITEQQLLRECYRRLTVADQRGFCLGGNATACPLAQGTYADACEQLNQGRPGC